MHRAQSWPSSGFIRSFDRTTIVIAVQRHAMHGVDPTHALMAQEDEQFPLLNRNLKIEGTADSIYFASRDVYNGWKKFALRKNILDVAIGLMVASALTNVSKSLIEDIVMPLFRALFSNPLQENSFSVLVRGKSGNVTYESIEQASSDGAITLNYGRFCRCGIII